MLDCRAVRPPWVLVALALAACTVGDGTENASSFGMSTAPVTMSSSASTASDTEVDDDDSGSSETATSSEEEDSTSESSPTSSGTSDATSGVNTGADTGTEQPEDGMYSACMDATDCIGLTACETGFCTKMCTDASVDCDPAPGGTAEPSCFMFGTSSLCALNCSGGETCPTPMQCTPVTGGSVCS